MSQISVKQRIIEFMEYKKITPYRFEKECGISQGYLKNLRTSPNLPIIGKILQAFPELNQQWLLSGNGPMLTTDAPLPTASLNEARISYTCGVPYYNVDFIAGFSLVINDQTTTPQYRIDFPQYNDADCWCNVSGHSMAPSIENGDIIAIKEVRGWADFLLYDEIYAIVTDDFRTIKVIAPAEDDQHYVLKPLNPTFSSQLIPKTTIKRVFRVLGCLKKI